MSDDLDIERGNRGAHNELVATVWLLKQGYSVFRNVSAHGPVDIVGMKDGELFKFDVKGTPFTVAGHRGRARLKPEQVEMGVKVINVFPDDTCDIDWEPITSDLGGPRACADCGFEFKPVNKQHIYCTPECKTQGYYKKHGIWPKYGRGRS